MLPVLVTLGPLTIYSFSLFLGVGFFLTAFIAWRRLIDLGLEEEKILDGLILAAVVGLVSAKLIFAAENFPLAGYSFWGGIAGAALVFFLLTRAWKWNFWQVGDELVFACLPFAVLSQVGAFLAGSTPGRPTLMPWGIYFPGMLVRSQPISLFMALGFFAMWLYFLQVERNWRGWSWYKSKDPGLIFLLFLALGTGLTLLIDFLTIAGIYWLGLKIVICLSALMVIGVTIFDRSGRKITWLKKSKK